MNFAANPNYKKLYDLLKSGAVSLTETSADAPAYQEFIQQYPLASLTGLTLDQYCVGKGEGDSFCWWLERGLQPVFGRYAPGTSRGHLLYFRREDGSLYRNRLLAGLSDTEALAYVLKICATIAGANLQEDVRWVDDNAEIYRRAGVDERVVGGDGRRLRLLMCYHPDQILPISSSQHLGHFLKALGFSEAEIPPLRAAVARTLLLDQVYLSLKKDLPQLTRLSFVRALYNKSLGLAPTKDEPDDPEDDEIPQRLAGPDHAAPLNQILFGPPGTGKTYATIDAALEVLDPQFLVDNRGDRKALKDRFDKLSAAGFIRFVTFHQSFSYEDFVEGLRASSVDGQLTYSVEEGMFKSICADAAARVMVRNETSVSLEGRRVWKMSLGNTLGDDAYIYDDCIANNQILLGYGGAADYSGCTTRDDIYRRYQAVTPDAKPGDFAVDAMERFLRMKKGDLVVVSEGLHKFRAIGEIAGDYHSLGSDDYGHARPVKWLRVYAPSLSRDQLINKQFSQATIYELKPSVFDKDKLLSLLSAEAVADDQAGRPHVLIIDEINRGNVARIFGELITLLEPSKRAGADEALSVVLPYSREVFSVPDNLYLIGTMNTADRSLAGLDIALRRRFVFREMPPRPELLDGVMVAGVDIGELLRAMNQRIEVLLDRDHCLGHAYFLPLRGAESQAFERLSAIFRNQILPLLQEYFFEDWERIRWVLNDHRATAGVEPFIKPAAAVQRLEQLFGNAAQELGAPSRWELNPLAFDSEASFRNIVGKA